MYNVVTHLKAHLPVYVGIAIVIVSTLQDQGVVRLSNGAITIINAFLAAFGLGVLNVRQQAQLRAARKAGQDI
jgi:uncharacterized membrane protein (Fun14 family)